MIKLRRRTTLAGIAALPLAVAKNVRAQAVDFPDRPLRLIVGFPPVGPNDLLAQDAARLLTLAHAQPGKLNGASAGAGGATHPALELFKSMGKADIVHVPYKGGGPAMADLMASLVDIYFGGLSTALPHVKAGKLRALGQ